MHITEFCWGVHWRLLKVRGFALREHGWEEPSQVSESNLRLLWATKSWSLGIHHSEGNLELRNPQKCISRTNTGFWASVDIRAPHFALAMSWPALLWTLLSAVGFSKAVCGHSRHQHILAQDRMWPLRVIAYPLDEGCYCYIISLLSKI